MFADLKTAAPNLEGALCSGSTAWDLLHPLCTNYQARITAAVSTCLSCPALAQCKALLDSMPAEERPARTVMAGQILL